jgi:hypothetical protein
MKTTSAWGRLLIRSAEDPFFLGSALNAFGMAHGLDLQQLADWLRCPSTSLDRLALCRLPDDKKPRFQEDIRQIAAFVSCDADQLLILVREIATLQALRHPSEPSHESLLMAARDRKKREEDQS